jgi:hypothetical protein
MANHTRNELRRAFDEMSEGLRSLLGLEHSAPALVGELLQIRRERPVGYREGCGRRTKRGRARLDWRRSRSRASSRGRLVLVESGPSDLDRRLPLGSQERG